MSGTGSVLFKCLNSIPGNTSHTHAGPLALALTVSPRGHDLGVTPSTILPVVASGVATCSVLDIAPQLTESGGVPQLKLRRQNGLYFCPGCEYSSPVVTNVRYHFNSKHCLVKPFQCGFCGSAFGTLVQRDNHVRRLHTGERPFRCEKCNRDFFSRNSQLYHSCIR
ncbi:zinc finger protein-like [Tropilaelaps mercedesae]|uniref:Zinc finger protein-like n=1 Tax=Tropilaelaps mercedesae TaxID=418985 RepID=A0A1V9WYI9_9ACAR|nr:zinc finger protein-like [Tropilaelaps mercedesae]